MQQEAKHFASFAERYEATLVPVIFRPWAKELIRRLNPKDGENILDLACGTGVVTREIMASGISPGSLTALDHNADMLVVAIAGKFEDDDEAAYDTMWEVNFKGPLHLTRAVLPALRTSGHGRVINIVSLSGKRLKSASLLGYSASKFAALALTHAIRHDGWSDGIRATAICPGLVETRMVADVEPPEGQFKIAPDTIAETVAYALSLPNEAVVAEILVNSRLEASF